MKALGPKRCGCALDRLIKRRGGEVLNVDFFDGRSCLTGKNALHMVFSS